MLIFGIDPGTATTGYGVIDVNGDELRMVKYGLIETNKDGLPGDRLISIHRQLLDLLARHSPDIVAIERLFFATNRMTAMQVSQAYGVMLLTIAQKKTPVYEYAPGSIKKTIAGNGRADKAAVQEAVRAILGPSVKKEKGKKTHFDNAADALAVALCHIHKEIDSNLLGGEGVGKK